MMVLYILALFFLKTFNWFAKSGKVNYINLLIAAYLWMGNCKLLFKFLWNWTYWRASNETLHKSCIKASKSWYRYCQGTIYTLNTRNNFHNSKSDSFRHDAINISINFFQLRQTIRSCRRTTSSCKGRRNDQILVILLLKWNIKTQNSLKTCKSIKTKHIKNYLEGEIVRVMSH